MGWRELNGWRRELERTLKERQEGRETPVDSWEGRDQDPFWTKADEERARLRGHI